MYNCDFGYRDGNGTNTPKKQVNALSEKFSQISSYSEKSNYEQAKDRLSTLNEKEFIDIPTDLNNGFYGKIISATQEQDFINHYKSHFQEAYSLLKKLEAFKITPSETFPNSSMILEPSINL